MRELLFNIGHLDVKVVQTTNGYGDQELYISIQDDGMLYFETCEQFYEGFWLELSEQNIKNLLESYIPKLF